MDRLKLPQYLPSRYRSWVHFYNEAIKLFADKPHDDNSVIKLGEIDRETPELDGIDFHQEFTVRQLKANAFNELYSILLSKDEAYQLIVEHQKQANYDPKDNIILKLQGIFNL